MNKQKIILIIGLFFFLLFPHFAKAQSLSSAQVEILPVDGVISEGYLNSTNTGFRINVELDQSYRPVSLDLYLGTLCPIPIDTRPFDNSIDYTLSSGTATLIDLKNKLTSCPGYEEGEHDIVVKGFDGGTNYTTLFETKLEADFTAPSGIFSSTNASNLKVGDSLNLVFTPNDISVSSVKSKIYGRELTWIKNGGVFKATYKIREGDQDTITNLILTDVELQDFAGNKVFSATHNIPITFSIDANSPKLKIISPYSKTYGTQEIRVKYQVSGHNQIKLYLDGKLLSSLTLSDLKNGSHILKIIATDLAGNKTVMERQFVVDLVAPDYEIGEIPNSLVEGDTLTLSGKTEPGATLVLTFADTSLETVANQDGHFSFSLENLKPGEYDLFLEISDGLGNTRKYLLSHIDVFEKPKGSIKVAQAPTRTDYAVSGTVTIQENKEVAKAGRITPAASDERISKNYMPYLILIGLVILAFSIASVGYYGFAYLNLAKQKKEIDNFDNAQIESEHPGNFKEDVPGHAPQPPVEGNERDEDNNRQPRW